MEPGDGRQEASGTGETKNQSETEDHTIQAEGSKAVKCPAAAA
jgi:hypothetical protein